MNNALLILLAVQIAMGAFDTFYHHEYKERLPWRLSQADELRLHGLRDLIYAGVFVVLATMELHGFWAWILGLLLVAEMVITLIDFVEEDRTRKLPPSERVTHTLLALNYGGILVLFAPVLWAWGQQATGLVGVYHGLWSVFLIGSAVVVSVLGFRDLLAAGRLQRLRRVGAEPLLAKAAEPQRILVTGGTGFVGRRLVIALAEAGHEVIVLTRDVSRADGLPARAIADLDGIHPSTFIDVVVSLAGEPMAAGPWTAKRRFRILASRIRMARKLRHLNERLYYKIPVVLAASAVGAYGVRGDAEPENAPLPSDPSFSARSCRMVEDAYRRVSGPETRVIALRMGLVLGTEGGILASMLVPFEFGLGAVFGHGRQVMSWIGLGDLVRLIWHCAEDPRMTGAVNAVAPQPVSQAEFAQSLALALHRPRIFRIPPSTLRMLGSLGEELFLGGQFVLPEKALASGFRFRDPALGPLLRRLCGHAGPQAAEPEEKRLLILRPVPGVDHPA